RIETLAGEGAERERGVEGSVKDRTQRFLQHDRHRRLQLLVPPPAAPVRSVQRPAGNLRAAHDAAEGAGVVDGEVLAGPVVPESDRALLPAEAAGELGPVAVVEQVVEQRPAL